MLFNSLDYLVFFLVVVVTAHLLGSRFRMRLVFLLLASYIFYFSNNGWLLALILLSTSIDYFAGLAMDCTDSARRKRLAVVASVVTNLSVLAYFKYVDFFRQTVTGIAASWGVELGWTDLNIILPVGISFYTFQSMSYTIDVYRGTLPAERSFVKFAFYVAYFPQLIAGPIMRASSFLPQLQRSNRVSLEDVEWGVFLICRGLIKKVVLADFLAVYSDAAFSMDSSTGSLELLLGLYAFAFQIYFDFSGYTDIAIGSSRLMGYRIPDNFNRPYAALGFSDFWKRWHISLSSWLRDYLYIALGGNRGGRFKTYRNLVITMLLGGLWHGAGWQYVVWGGMHGLYLAIERILGGEKLDVRTLSVAGLFMRRLLVFHCIVLTWLPFRSDDIGSAYDFLVRLISFAPGGEISRGMLMVLLIALGSLAVQWVSDHHRLRDAIFRIPVPARSLVYGCAALVVIVANAKGLQPFIYFQF